MKKIGRLKRTVAAIAAAALLGGSVSAFAAGADIQGHWGEAVITKWLDAEKIGGYADGTFRPDNAVTRGEFAKILSNVLPNAQNFGEEKKAFSDVKPTDWFYASLEKLLTLGVVTPGELYRPNAPITRQDAMTMIGRAFYVREFEMTAIEGFKDYGDVADYAKDFVAGLVAKGSVGGYSDNTLRPLANITRAESLKILDTLDIVHPRNSLEDILERTYAGLAVPGPRTATVKLTNDNAQYYLGLDNIDFAEEALASDSIIGSQAHSVCLVRVKEGGDVAALAEKIRTSVNPRKWICVGVEREEIVMKTRGNLILMVIDQSQPKAIGDSFMALDLSVKKPTLRPDSNNLMETEGYYMDFIGALRPKSVEQFAAKVEKLTADYLQKSSGVYYSVIPSKSYFVNERVATPFDYEAMDRILQTNITHATYINLFDTLTLQDYYKTDPHWRQESLQKVVDKLGAALQFQTDLSSYGVNTVEGFKGQHGYKKPAFPTEQLTYLTSPAIDGAVVKNSQPTGAAAIYDKAQLATDAPYNLFLSGPSPLVTITNGQAKTEKELVIFRDSYSSSLAPLLVEHYKTITLVDLRYMVSSMVGDLVSCDGKDILFLFNDRIVNNSEMLK